MSVQELFKSVLSNVDAKQLLGQFLNAPLLRRRGRDLPKVQENLDESEATVENVDGEENTEYTQGQGRSYGANRRYR